MNGNNYNTNRFASLSDNDGKDGDNDEESVNEEGKKDIEEINNIIIPGPLTLTLTLTQSNLDKPVGKIVCIESFEDVQNYFNYDVNFDWDDTNITPYKIIFYFEPKDANIENFFKQILKKFFSSDFFNKIKKNIEIYPEIITTLLSDFMEFINDDQDLRTQINTINTITNINQELLDKYAKKLETFFKCYCSYGFKVDNSIEFYKRTLLYDLMIANTWPKDYLKSNVFKSDDKFLNFCKLKRNNKNEIIPKDNEYFIPEKRETFYNKEKIKKISSTPISLIQSQSQLPTSLTSTSLTSTSRPFDNFDFEDYEILTNYRVIDQIDIVYDFEFIIKWLVKTFAKFFLDDLTKSKCESMTKFFDEQLDTSSHSLSPSPHSLPPSLFKDKYKFLRKYFLNFSDFYNDDKFIYTYGIDKDQTFYSCIRGFTSIKNKIDDDDDNFRYLFIYVLMSQKTRVNLSKYLDLDANSDEKEKKKILNQYQILNYIYTNI